jgi:hypothetical protein
MSTYKSLRSTALLAILDTALGSFFLPIARSSFSEDFNSIDSLSKFLTKFLIFRSLSYACLKVS